MSRGKKKKERKNLMKLIFRLDFYLEENGNITALEKGPLDFS